MLTSLSYYLQIDVIETNASALAKRLSSLKEIDSARKLHDKFVVNVMESSFMTQSGQFVLEALTQLFHISFSFYGLCSRNESRLGADAAAAALSTLEKRLQRDVVAVLIGNLSIATAAADRALWSRLDFNRYFSTMIVKGRTASSKEVSAGAGPPLDQASNTSGAAQSGYPLSLPADLVLATPKTTTFDPSKVKRR
jgi:hypothetical protein